jgi:hypothetical protein
MAAIDENNIVEDMDEEKDERRVSFWSFVSHRFELKSLTSNAKLAWDQR